VTAESKRRRVCSCQGHSYSSRELADTRFSWELEADGNWHRTQATGRTKSMSAQEVLMKRATKRAKKRSGSR
jgi:polyphosphate kinase